MEEIDNTKEIIELYKQLIQLETANHTIFISVLLGIAVILLGATWWWNKTGAAKQIVLEVENRINDQREILLTEINHKIEDKIKIEVEKYEATLLEIQADASRSLAILSMDKTYHPQAIYWWAKHVEAHLKLDNLMKVRNGVNILLKEIGKMENKERSLDTNKKITVPSLDFVVGVISKLPDVLATEKENILKRMKGREVNEN